MEDFFALFYQNVIVGNPLFSHLRGWDDALAGYNSALDQFPKIFLITVGVALGVFFLYYYIINHPRLNKWWCWLISLAILGVFGYMFGKGIVMHDIRNDLIAESLQQYIGQGNAITFGLYNAGLCMAFYFLVFTLPFRRWSKNCKHSPWVLLSTKLNNKGAKNHE